MKRTLVGMVFACWALVQSGAAELHWLTDLSKAQAQAKAEKKLVLMDFTGSDWCPPCKAFAKNVLSSPGFADYAEKHLVLVEVDFPQQKPQTEEQKKANETLAKKFNVEGFPTVVVLNGEGKELKRQFGYSGQSAKEFVAILQRLQQQ